MFFNCYYVSSCFLFRLFCFRFSSTEHVSLKAKKADLGIASERITQDASEFRVAVDNEVCVSNKYNLPSPQDKAKEKKEKRRTGRARV